MELAEQQLRALDKEILSDLAGGWAPIQTVDEVCRRLGIDYRTYQRIMLKIEAEMLKKERDWDAFWAAGSRVGITLG
jgi:hypothetical protein